MIPLIYWGFVLFSLSSVVYYCPVYLTIFFFGCILTVELLGLWTSKEQTYFQSLIVSKLRRFSN